MKRLKPGEYKKMTAEQQLNHRRALRNRWLRKPGNRQKVRDANKIYLQKHWQKKRDTPVERICNRCGKLALLYGNQRICSDCRNKPSKRSIIARGRQLRREIRQERNAAIIYLATNTTLSQKQIAIFTNSRQEIVSGILRHHCISKRYVKRTKNEQTAR